MKVVKQKNEHGLNIFIQEEQKYLAFSFGGNGDLYWSIHISNSDTDKYNFIITKENYSIYSLFLQLFNDIENINIFGEIEIPFYIENDEEKREYIKQRNEEIENDKKKYQLFNYSNYNKLFDKTNEIITWYSDETAHDVANILKIKKEKEIFKIEFYTQTYVEGYDEDFYSLYCIPIRFRNSGSSYHPFNIIFMKMYNNMKEIDDAKEIGHQIHIEEYLYNKNKIKKLIK